ncbi:MAG: prolipoprotein diacylglyceryl transferase [Planctomycetales bacterium 4484_113]|nr:MAG: prolipoprotein diacylglyceryl transferase [Planctomycetales bacterium 4484_113]
MFNPEAFSIFGYAIRWYGIAMALALLEGAWLAAWLLRRRGRASEYIWDGVLWAAILGIIGARVGYVITSPGEFIAHPIEVFGINQGGLSFHGGIVGGILGCWLYFRRSPLRFIEVMDAAAPGVAIGIMLVRFLGNLSNGDILGYKVSREVVPWAMNFPFDQYHEFGAKATEVIYRHPAEIYGGLVGLIVLIIVLVVWFRKTAPGTNFWTFILSYSLVRSLIEEPFRHVPHFFIDAVNTHYGIGGITMTQWVSIPLIILSIWGLIVVRRKGRPEDWDTVPEWHPPERHARVGASEKEAEEREAKPRRVRRPIRPTAQPRRRKSSGATPRKPFTK